VLEMPTVLLNASIHSFHHILCHSTKSSLVYAYRGLWDPIVYLSGTVHQHTSVVNCMRYCNVSLVKASQLRLPTTVVKIQVKQSRYTPWRRLGGEEVFLLLILDLGSRWGWVVSVTPRPRFYPRGKDPRYPLYRRLGGPQSWSGHRD
jgi:hypothetical protein